MSVSKDEKIKELASFAQRIFNALCQVTYAGLSYRQAETRHLVYGTYLDDMMKAQKVFDDAMETVCESVAEVHAWEESQKKGIK